MSDGAKYNLLRRYGQVSGIESSPISALGLRYFEKNYGKILGSISKDSKTLEVGPGGASFTQYLIQKGYRHITVCEAAEDTIKSVKKLEEMRDSLPLDIDGAVISDGDTVGSREIKTVGAGPDWLHSDIDCVCQIAVR